MDKDVIYIDWWEVTNRESSFSEINDFCNKEFMKMVASLSIPEELFYAPVIYCLENIADSNWLTDGF